MEDEIWTVRAVKADRSARIPSEFARRDLAGENRVKIYREMRGLTQASLAAKIGSKTAYVSQIETGWREGGKALLRKITAALDLPLSVFVD
jgi:ribosome-binding protein aMBF1 (putative translation factor)